MKTLVVIALLIAACGYGAFSHFSAEELKISQLNSRKERADAASVETDKDIGKAREELVALKRTLDETIATAPAAELAKARVPFIAKRDALAKELASATAAAEAANEAPAELAKELADLEADLAAATANIQKLDKEYASLSKYKAAEEAAMPAAKRPATRK